MHLDMRWGLGLVLAFVASLSGCCCPMHCGNSCWVEQLQDNYCCMAEQMQDQACCMNQAIINEWNELTYGSHDDCCSQSDDYCSPSGQHESCSDCSSHHHGDCQASSAQPGRRLDGPSPIRQFPPAASKSKRCRRCEQAVDRNGNCQHCSGFEAVGRRAPPAPPRPRVEPTCAAPQMQTGGAPAMPPAPPAFQPAPVPANQEPAAAPPSPGPTPIKRDPIPGPPPQIPGAATQEANPAPPADETSRINKQPGQTAAAPQLDGPALEQTGFQSSPPSPKPDGWRPTPSS